MKRDDLQPGEEYFTSYGAHVRVVDLETGWLLKGGQWVKDNRTGIRIKPGKDGSAYQNYPLNPNVRCMVIAETGEESRGVVRPQLIACTWAEHQRQQRLEAREQRAVRKTASQVQRVLRSDGVRHGRVDVEQGTITIPIAEIAHLVGLEGQAS